MNNVFLGYPPENIKQWIINHRPTPPVQGNTFFWVNGEKNEYDIEGTLDQQWFIDNGYFDGDNWEWLKQISKAELGSKVTSIGDSAFGNCEYMSSVTIGSSVTSIGGSAFSGCYSLASVTIPDSVTSIGSSAFAHCYLSSVTIPDSVTSIGSSAFSYCSLSSVTIGSSVTSIGDNAFSSCGYLTSITIPNSVTSIDDSAFEYCDSLTSVIIAYKTMAEVEDMITNVRILGWSDSSGKTTTFTCSDGTVEAYFDQDEYAWHTTQIPFNS